MSSGRGVNVFSKAVYVVAAQRTPCGAFGGALKGMSATDLATHAAEATIAKAGINPEAVDHVILGNVQQTSSDAAYMPRHVALRAGMQIDTPALTVNRLCGSGFEAVAQGAREIVCGEAKLVLAGGTESMSQAPYAVRNIRFGTKLGADPALEDTLWQGLTDSLCKTPMGVTAENLAARFNVTRQESDEFALRSQQLWAKAQAAGIYKDEIAPVTLKSRKGPVEMTDDEHPRPATTLESLAKLPTVFKKDGVVTAASSSGICDGAATLMLASEEAVKEYNLTPLARVVGHAVAGVEPTEMGIGPVPAVRKLLELAGKSLGDMGQIEVNEAFGAQCLAVAKDLGIDMDKLNVNGGAIAIGHPLGMSGARILGHLTHSLSAGRAGQFALGAACIGGGQGIAVLLEKA